MAHKNEVVKKIYYGLFGIVGLMMFISSCDILEQPKCDSPETLSLLKKIVAKKLKRDTAEIAISYVRTRDVDLVFKRCDCSASVYADAKLVFDAFLLHQVDEKVDYDVQITDDGTGIVVNIN